MCDLTEHVANILTRISRKYSIQTGSCIVMHKSLLLNSYLIETPFQVASSKCEVQDLKNQNLEAEKDATEASQ